MTEPQQDGIVSEGDLDDVLAEADAAYAEPTAPAAEQDATPAAPQDTAQPPTPATAQATQPAQATTAPAATAAQAAPPWWQSVKDYKTFESSLASAPPEQKAMLDHMADTVFKPHYQDLMAALERSDAAVKAWESLLAEAKTKGIDVAAAERVQKLTTDVETAQQAAAAAEAKVKAYGDEYSAVVRDSFLALCPDFKAGTAIGEAFLASMAAGKHQQYMQGGVSEATALARMWRAMVPAPAAQPATPAAATALPSAARIANASRGARPAAPSLRAPQQQSVDDILNEADLAFPIHR